MEVQWALVLFTVVSGAGAWLFAWSVLQSLMKRGSLPGKTEAVASFALLVVGGCLSVLHLKHVDRIFEALNHPTSGIFIEAAMIGIMCAIVAVYFVMLLRGAGEGSLKVVGAIGAIVGAVFTFECGASYLMEARAAWMTPMLPLGYCATAAAAGAGMNGLLRAVAKQDEKDLSFSGLLTLVANVVSLAVCAAYCVISSEYLTVNGAALWVAVLFIALAAGAAAGVVQWKKPQQSLALSTVALVAGLLAAIALRVAMWAMGTPLMDLFLMPLG